MPTNGTKAATASDAEIRTVFERLAVEAGREVVDYYRSGASVEHKADSSPVTEADRVSERIILAGLRAAFPEIPCVAEEESAAGLAPRLVAGSEFILVDPLDGTREFVSRNPDFTVNIALVRAGKPVIGVVYAPCAGRLFSGQPGLAEAVRMTEQCEMMGRRRIEARQPSSPLIVVASRSHRTLETDAFIGRIEAAEIVSIGSSLKFGLVAAGEADLYPRFGPTMEWDTAAGDAVLRAAGGITETLDRLPMIYGKPGFANPHFVARGLPAPLPVG